MSNQSLFRIPSKPHLVAKHQKAAVKGFASMPHLDSPRFKSKQPKETPKVDQMTQEAISTEGIVNLGKARPKKKPQSE